MRLSNPLNGTVLANDGVLTITNDDSSAIAPSVTSVSPSTVGQFASGRALTISGSQFAPSSTVSFNKTGITIVSGSLVVVDANTITLKINTNKTVPLGGTDVTVTTPSGSATCTGCLTVNAKPTVTSANSALASGPAFLGLGAKTREVIVTGTNFQPGARVSIPGANVTSASYISSTQIEVLVSPQAATTVGATSVTVTNPDVGRETCTCFSFVAPPVVTGMSPSTLHRGTTVDVTLTGSNFTPGAKVTGLAGMVVSTVRVVDANTIVASISVASTTKLGSGKAITVTNPLSTGYGVGTFLGMTVAN